MKSAPINQIPSGLSTLSSLDSYIDQIRQIPLLTQEEEHELAQKYKQEGDLIAAKKLILSHLRFVAHVARSYQGYGLSLNDLIQEGNIGLMKAVKMFDPDREVRLITFAIYWIRAEIHEYIIKNWRIVKIATTKAQRKLFFNLRKMKKNMSWLSPAEVENMADELGVDTKTLRQMEMRLSGNDVNMEQTDTDGQVTGPINWLEDVAENPALVAETEDNEKQQKNQLSHALSKLDPRSLDIIQRRWLSEKKTTLEELADKYSVSAERIRQIEKQAMKKARNYIEEGLI